GTTARYKATIHWGDNTTPTSGTIAPAGPTFTVSGSHTYSEEGTYTISATITDVGGGSAMATSSAVVADAPLTGAGTTVTPVTGTAFTGVMASFRDSAPGDHSADFSAVIDWGVADARGKEVTSAGTVRYNAGSGTYTVAGSNTYARDGSYAVGVTI